VGWTGLIISILFAGGGVFFTRVGGSIQLAQNELITLVGILSALIGSLVMSLAAFRLWNFMAVPEAQTFVDIYAREAYQTTLKAIVGSMVTAIEYNQYRNKIKGYFIGLSWALFLVGMIATAIFIYFQASKIVGN
jgi:hypothetical protein